MLGCWQADLHPGSVPLVENRLGQHHWNGQLSIRVVLVLDEKGIFLPLGVARANHLPFPKPHPSTPTNLMPTFYYKHPSSNIFTTLHLSVPKPITRLFLSVTVTTRGNSSKLTTDLCTPTFILAYDSYMAFNTFPPVSNLLPFASDAI